MLQKIGEFIKIIKKYKFKYICISTLLCIMFIFGTLLGSILTQSPKESVVISFKDTWIIIPKGAFDTKSSSWLTLKEFNKLHEGYIKEYKKSILPKYQCYNSI